MPITDTRLTATESLRSEQETLLAGKLYAGTKQQNQAAALTITAVLQEGSNPDTMEVEVTVTGGQFGQVFNLEVWFSESALGAGLTATAYSGTMAANTGEILTTLTAKKHFIVTTATGGIFVGIVTDTGNSAGQYACIKHPLTGATIVSNVSSASTWGS